MFNNYLTIVIRLLLRYKGYSLINVLGLAIGIAGCVLIVLYVHDELSFDQYHLNKDRIYRLAVSETAEGRHDVWARSPSAWGPALAQEYPEIEAIARIRPPASRWLIRYGEKRFYEENFVFADSTVFEIFTMPLVQGNANTALTEPHSVVLSESMAQKYFGDENPIGKVMTGDDKYEFSVTGIMRDLPDNSHFRFDFLASFASLAPNGLYGEPSTMQNQHISLFTYMLLRNGSVAEDLERKLPGFLDKHLSERLEALGIVMTPFLQPLTEIHLHSNLIGEFASNGKITYVYIFSTLAAFVLLIACVNFMNLSTARSARRAQEIGIRKVLGVKRNQLISQFMGESILYSLIALIVAMGLVHLFLPQFNHLSGKTLEIHYDSSWLVPTLISIAIAAGIVAGGYPSFVLSSFRPVAVLTGALKAGASHSSLRKLLIIFQFVVSIVMIVGTIVVLDQLEYLQDKNLGFEEENVVVVRLPDPEAVQRYPAFKNAILQYPEVSSVSSASSVPGYEADLSVIQPEGFQEDQHVSVRTIWADFDYIETLGIEVKSGRSFSRDRPSDTIAILINEAAARAFGWDDPVGKTIRYPGPRGFSPPFEINGVIADYHNQSLHQPIEPLMIMASPWSSYSYVVVRLDGNDESRGLEILKDQWGRTYPEHPAMDFSLLDENLDQLYHAEQRLGSVFSAGATLSILIACLGLLGLSSFMAEQRTKEIGVRKVVGASITNIVLLLSKDLTMLILVAFVIGTPIGYFALQAWLGNFAYRIEMDIWVFVFSGFVTLVIAWLTNGYQAITAATANPVDALQSE
ncbi:MAG: ABC transporter permease [Gemmatimonadota bacterium]|nr:ABC transporter permease [Gemmatimonadota bacterium]